MQIVQYKSNHFHDNNKCTNWLDIYKYVIKRKCLQSWIIYASSLVFSMSLKGSIKRTQFRIFSFAWTFSNYSWCPPLESMLVSRLALTLIVRYRTSIITFLNWHFLPLLSFHYGPIPRPILHKEWWPMFNFNQTFILVKKLKLAPRALH
jgi:hypothetical protein